MEILTSLAKGGLIKVVPEHYEKWIVVALLWLGACLNYIDRMTIFAVLPVLKKEMVLSDVTLALFGSTFLWAYALSSPLSGYLGDRFDRKKVILCSLIIFSLVTFATGFARTGSEVIALRILLGISEALFLPAALAHIATFHTNATRSIANAVALTGLTAGAGLGGFYGGYMADYHSWRAGFYLLGIGGVLLCLLLGVFLPPNPEAYIKIQVSSGQDPLREPVLPKILAVLRTPTAACIIFLGFAFSFSSWALGSWGPTYLHERFAMSLTDAGGTMALFTSAPALVSGLLGGWLADRWAKYNPASRFKVQLFGLCLIAPTMALFGFVPSVGEWGLDLLLYSVGRGIVEVSSMPIFSMVTPPTRWSTVYGLYNFAGCLAGSLGVLFVGIMKAPWGIGYGMSSLSLFLFAAIAVMALALVRFFRSDIEKNKDLLATPI